MRTFVSRTSMGTFSVRGNFLPLLVQFFISCILILSGSGSLAQDDLESEINDNSSSFTTDGLDSETQTLEAGPELSEESVNEDLTESPIEEGSEEPEEAAEAEEEAGVDGDSAGDTAGADLEDGDAQELSAESSMFSDAELPPGKVERRNYVRVAPTENTERKSIGAYFSFGMHKYSPFNYAAILLQDQESHLFEDVFAGQPSDLFQGDIGLKWNLGPISLGLGGNYGMSSHSVDDPVGTFSLDIKKYGLGARIAVDNVFETPWVVPYANFNFYKMVFTESYGSDTDEYETGFGLAYSFGIMVNLNWADTDTVFSSRQEIGLRNTYLDLFAMKYENTSAETEGEPFTESDFNYGVGLTFEF
mgnify:CR=1 FL=1